MNVLDIITITCFITTLHLDVTKMSSASRTEHQEALGFAYRSRKKFMWIAVIFVTDCFYLCGMNFDDVLQCSRKEDNL